MNIRQQHPDKNFLTGTNMPNKHIAMTNQVKDSLTKLLILLALCTWVFWRDLVNIISTATKSSEKVHILIAPAAILLLIYHRRRVLVNNITNGSTWGIALLIGGLALYAGATWPFSYRYACHMAMVPVLAGVVLSTCGWRVLKSSTPILLLLMLSLPMSSGLNARLVIRPETYTIATTTKVLDQLPGVDASIRGKDLFFSSSRGPGVIALGESNRGVRLLFAFGLVGLFTVFSQIRSRWRVITAMILAMPIVFFCNFLRFFFWGLVTIYTGAGPASALPRNTSAVFSLLASYGLFLLVCTIQINLFVETEEQVDNANTNQVRYEQR
jgi:exosortase/archaeosortase family protein